MDYKGKWQKLEDKDLGQLTELAQKVYPNFDEVPEKFIWRIFEAYKQTTMVFIQKAQIKGFAVYQEWPDCLNFIMIYLPFSKERNLRVILQGRPLLPNKKIVWFSEEEMKAKGV